MKLAIVLSAQPATFQAATFQGDLEENLELISRLGYSGAELAIRDPNLVDLETLDSLIRKHQLGVPAIGTGQAWGEEGLSFTDPDPAIRTAAVQRIISHIPLAAHFQAVVIIGLVRGIVKPGVDREQALAWLVEALRECSAAARGRGVRLALEPINRYETTLVNTVSQGLELIKEVGAENFGLLLDSFHMNLEEVRLEESIQACGDRIYHFHLADSNRWYPGGGHLDFKAILKALADSRYPGWVSGEFLPLPDAETAAARCLAHLRQLQS